jgi:hypothetical protein
VVVVLEEMYQTEHLDQLIQVEQGDQALEEQAAVVFM